MTTEIATLRLTTPVVPETRPGATVRTRLRLTGTAGAPFEEGGLRLRSLYKASQPERPLVSVVTVCRNATGTIEAAMQSVFAQTWSNVEYIVVDGASTDGTLELLRRHDEYIDYFVSEPDTGLYQAMNKGLSLVSGDYVLLLNADDTYVPTAIEELLRAKRYAGTSFVSALAIEVDVDGTLLKPMRPMPYDASTRLRMPLRHETMLISTALYDALGGYDERYRIAADFAFTLQLFDAGCTHYEIPRPLLCFRKDGLSNTDGTGMRTERIRVIAERFPFLTSDACELLARRDDHTGEQLLALAAEHASEIDLMRAVHAYVDDNARHVRHRNRPQWSERGPALLNQLHTLRKAQRPKVSVILAVYDAQSTLRACLDSVLAQTLGDFELICINDQTPDNSQLILQEYAQRDPRIITFGNPRNLGLGATRNRGVQRARGAYVFHVDPDDTLPAHALQVLYDAAVQHRSDLVRGAYLRQQFHNGRADTDFDEVMHPLPGGRTVVNARAADVGELLQMPEGHWAFLYRAELARRVPYPEDLKMGQDAIFLCCVLPAAQSITVIADVVYHYLANAKSAMNVFNLRKYLDVLEWRRRALHVLTDYGLRELGVRLLRTYASLGWHDQFSAYFASSGDTSAVETLGRALRAAYAEAGLQRIPEKAPEGRRKFLQHLLDDQGETAARALRQSLPTSQPASQQPSLPAAVPEATRPKVSVILPYFRAEATIAASLDSALSQCLRDIEVVCINDRSPDGSATVVETFQARDARVINVVNPVNIGHGASRNHGVKVARGMFVLHLDPDDLLPPGALERLYATAIKHGSDMVRGAYLHEQTLLGQGSGKPVRKGMKQDAPAVVNTTLTRSPELLSSTEGHWSYLYRAAFARQVPYPIDLKMGQDSIFIVHALIAAKSITLTGELAYHYRANPASAMNNFSHRKFLDSVEWRRRAWHALSAAGHEAIGRRLLLAYWSEPFFKALRAVEKPAELREFTVRLRASFAEAGLSASDLDVARAPQRLIADLFAALPAEASAAGQKAPPALPGGSLRVATFVSRDHGGAGTGTLRRVDALRGAGVDAHVHALVSHSTQPYVHRLSPPTGKAAGLDAEAVWSMVRERAIRPAREVPGYCAQELFSLPESVLDFRALRPLFDATDVLHFHWVVGMFDYDNAAEVLADRPVIWTLADMSAFTGGCHYSEGCDGYLRECRDCPLLGGKSNLAHESWKRKKAAYQRLRRLHIVCPSQWMAEHVAASPLLGDKPIHVIPNAFPTGRLRPTNKIVARIRLGLPVHKKLLLFGADSLANKRKGGAWLKQAMAMIAQRGSKDIEVVVFGNSTIDLPLPIHSLGHIAEEERLALAYSAADAFVFPSSEDNAPLTVGEALLCGTPVVAFPVGNVPDLLADRETGYLARHQDAADLVCGIDWALNVDAKAAMRRSIRCRQSAAAYHDPVLAANRHVEVYRQAMMSSDESGIT